MLIIIINIRRQYTAKIGVSHYVSKVYDTMTSFFTMLPLRNNYAVKFYCMQGKYSVNQKYFPINWRNFNVALRRDMVYYSFTIEAGVEVSGFAGGR